MLVRWQPGYNMMMTGPTAFVYEGVFSPDGLMAQAGIKVNKPYADDNDNDNDDVRGNDL